MATITFERLKIKKIGETIEDEELGIGIDVTLTKTGYGADAKVTGDLLKNKVGYAEYEDSYLYLYSDSTKEKIIAALAITSGGGGEVTGITETKCRQIIESYGYAVSDDFYSKAYIDENYYTRADISELYYDKSEINTIKIALQNKIDAKATIAVVDELPSDPDPNIVYLIKGITL